MNDKQADWHALETSAAIDKLATSEKGLSQDEAAQRLEKHGPNSLPRAPRRPGWLRFLSQFHNVLIYVLLIAGVAAAALDHWVDAAVILAVVLINAAIGFIQEGKAEKAMEAISEMLALKARVRRGGQWRSIPAEELVPGDIVEVRAGDRVPADIRLLETHGLRVDQAALTGESVPVGKRAEADEEDTDLADRRAMIYSGSMTTNGQATGMVTVTGEKTELGRISDMLQHVEQLTTPLLQRINVFGRWLTVIILLLTVLVIGLGALFHGLPLSEGLLAGIALAVAAIPEGLPAIITITLAVGVRQMADRKAIIRRLPAVETLGSVNTICSDKTGTLTRNELKARHVVLPDSDFRPEQEQSEAPAADALLQAGALCNDFEPGGDGGDPLERALIELAEAGGLDIETLRANHKRLGLIPFSSDHKFMAVHTPGLISVKGAPEAILELCDRQYAEDETEAVDLDYWQNQLEQLTSEGLRVLAVARRDVPEDAEALQPEDQLEQLCLIGLVGFADPPRDEVPAAVRECQDAGIRIKMITGDHAATAVAIARELGIGNENAKALSGRDIDGIDDEELARRVGDTDVFARTTPEHKLRLVKALQARREVVAMTGDGANDAPALKRADIGVAMGIKGTEASRQAAEMVLADDNFATIKAGVEEGRGVYDNIRKSILFLLPTNTAQSLVIILAVLAGLALPITPVQILWVNMATAITLALALAFEPLESDVMKRPPRPISQGLVTSFVAVRVIWVGLLLTAGAFSLYGAVLQATDNEALARTMAVNVLVAGQISYLFNCRRWQAPSLALQYLFANPWAWVTAGLLIVMQLGFTYLPFAQNVFGTASLPASAWAPIAGFALLVFLLVELEKLITRRLRLDWASPGGSV
ncbi:HAD-IC family P-type ATPase [Wenzhouxiangella sp. AB-CW3]|uniref:cation-translocating P-type ATPase n=1 Tax=Wenzhouxiangella sp. AB-CW3 TaxID=2771012 RepID=UPI00168BCB65|nr:HAD-IC family P-type ATPase [Wenzhouxiangella sp. AB-CW3]QOC23529.1 HAD-IC family P-type ATPase [Wenzhouxiangella sp. AB-CW3]